MPWYKFTAEVFVDVQPVDLTKQFDERVRTDFLHEDRITQVTNTSWVLLDREEGTYA